MKINTPPGVHEKVCDHKVAVALLFVVVLLSSLFLIFNEDLSEGDYENTFNLDVYGTQSDIPLTYNGESQRGVSSDDWYTLSGDISAVKAGEYTVTATLLDPANTSWSDGTTEPKEIVWSIAQKIINVNMISTISSHTYTGYTITPDISISDGTTVLLDDIDYTISYSENIDVGRGTITITGIGNYCGIVEKTFSITYKTIRVPLRINNLIYSGLEQIGVESSEWYILVDDKGIAAGSYTATATLIDPNTTWADSSEDPKTITWSIKSKPLTFNMVETIPGQEYSGEWLVPTISIFDGSIHLTINEDYTTLYLNNTNSGQGTVTITGIGNYTGTVDKNFNINSKIIVIPVANAGLEYNINEQVGVESSNWYILTNHIFSDVGNYSAVATLIDTENTKWDDISISSKIINWSISPKILTYNMIEPIMNQEYSGDFQTPIIQIKHNGVSLIIDSDYTASYASNTDVGISTITVTGIGRYTGSIEKVFNITEKTVSLPVIAENLIYNGTNITGVLEGSGYTITGNTGTDAGSYTATATLTDADNTMWPDLRTEPKIISWTIGKAPLSVIINDFRIVFGDDAPTYDSSYSGFVGDDDSSVVTGNIEFACTYVVRSNIGNYAITASGLESSNYTISYVNGTLTVDKKMINPPVVIIGLVYNGEEQIGIEPGEDYVSSGDRAMNAGTYDALVMLNSNTTTFWEDGTTEGRAVDWSIAQKPLSSEMIVPICTQICAGTPVEPVVMKDDTNELTEGTDYTVSYDNNASEGIGTAVVTGIGNYAGKVHTMFNILLGYLVEYNLNGFTGAVPESQILVSGSVLDLTSISSPICAGYTFIGWSLSSAGQAITEYTVTDNATLYALWDNSGLLSFVNLITEDDNNDSPIVVTMVVIAVIDLLLIYIIFIRRA